MLDKIFKQKKKEKELFIFEGKKKRKISVYSRSSICDNGAVIFSEATCR